MSKNKTLAYCENFHWNPGSKRSAIPNQEDRLKCKGPARFAWCWISNNFRTLPSYQWGWKGSRKIPTRQQYVIWFTLSLENDYSATLSIPLYNPHYHEFLEGFYEADKQTKIEESWVKRVVEEAANFRSVLALVVRKIDWWELATMGRTCYSKMPDLAFEVL